MSRWLKTLPLALALAASSIVTTGCNSSSQAQVRFVHAIQNAGELNIDVNGTSEFTNISFTNWQPTSGYKATPGGLVTFEGFLAGTSTEVFSTSNVKLFAGTPYTVVATGFASGGTGNVVIVNSVDNNTEPANGIINFRIINASPSAPGPLDIYIQQSQVQGLTPPATIAGLPYQGTSKYIAEKYNSNGGGYTVYVCPADSTVPIFHETFVVGGSNEGSIRTLILTDQPDVDQLNPQFIVLDDLN
jgi:hypothetical protein